MMQIDFLTELFEKCREENIHTCLDTSGITFNENPEYLKKLIVYWLQQIWLCWILNILILKNIKN